MTKLVKTKKTQGYGFVEYRSAKELHLVDYLVTSDISEDSFLKEWDELDK